MKYNVDRGTISLTATQVGDRFRVGVTDTGPGIPGDRISLLFTPFERLGAEQTEVEGTRLGLTLSKNLVEAMGGALEVDSMAGEGTTFWIELRTTHAPSVGTSEADIENVVTGSITSGAKLLLVEDNLANVSLIERLLSRRTDLELIRQ